MGNDHLCTSFVISYVLLLSFLLVDSRRFGRSKAVLKTIKTPEGEVIECVDIYKQPAFSHPLLLNHTLQVEPSFDTSRLTSKGDKRGVVQQSWHKYGECPHSSIPIIRKQVTNAPLFRPKLSPFSMRDDPKYTHQWAIVNLEKKGGIQGSHAKINNWSPFTNPEGGSMSQVWMAAGKDDNLNTIEFGWHVVPTTGMNYPTMFIYWTKDNYNTGCYNLECPGFVQTSQTVALGARLDNISAYNGVQFDIEYDVRLDPTTKNWLLSINGVSQGYWPSSLFPTMSSHADIIGWGGEIIDYSESQSKDPTQMGNGHYPDEGYKKACYMTDIKYVNNDGADIYPTPKELTPLLTGDICGDLKIESTGHTDVFVYFGGPGCRRRVVN